MIELAICDDERVEADYLAALAQEWAVSRGVDVRVRTFESAEALLFGCGEGASADVLIIDIQMKGMDGMALARRIRRDDEGAQIVFVTGYPDYMAEGYDVGALHYLMKPVREDKLFDVLDRAKKRLSQDQTILLDADGGLARVRMDEIASAEAFDHMLEIRTTSGRFSVRMTLSELEGRLSGAFVRCHRCAIVNLLHVRRITRTEVALDSGETVPLSRRLYADVNRAMLRSLRGDGDR